MIAAYVMPIATCQRYETCFVARARALSNTVAYHIYRSECCCFLQVVPYGGLPQCTGCALSNSTAGSSATVLCHPSLLTLEAVAQDAEQCLRGCVGKVPSLLHLLVEIISLRQSTLV